MNNFNLSSFNYVFFIVSTTIICLGKISVSSSRLLRPVFMTPVCSKCCYRIWSKNCKVLIFNINFCIILKRQMLDMGFLSLSLDKVFQKKMFDRNVIICCIWPLRKERKWRKWCSIFSFFNIVPYEHLLPFINTIKVTTRWYTFGKNIIIK